MMFGELHSPKSPFWGLLADTRDSDPRSRTFWILATRPDGSREELVGLF